MIKTLITEFPLSDFPIERTVTEEKIRKYTYTKEEVKILLEAAVKEAVDEARRIDNESMAKHNREGHCHQYDSWIYYSCIVCRWTIKNVGYHSTIHASRCKHSRQNRN